MADTDNMASATGSMPATQTPTLRSSGEQLNEKADNKDTLMVADTEAIKDVSEGEVIDESGTNPFFFLTRKQMRLTASSEFTEQQYNKLRKKIDLYLIPLM